MRSLRREHGFSLIELMLAMTLSLLILGATLAVFATAERGHRDNQRQNEAQDQVRFATDSLARRLRNLASPTDAGATPEQPLERANAQDLVFRTVNSAGAADPATNPQNLQRYRYCLGTGQEPLCSAPDVVRAGGPRNARGHRVVPPADGRRHSVAASSVTNGGTRSSRYVLNPSGSFSEQASVAPADFASVVAIGTRLFVDPLPGVLRTSRRSPRAFSSATRTGRRRRTSPPTIITGTKVQLNGTDSDDPEGARLTFAWYLDGVKLANTSATPTVTLTAGDHSVYLVVTDVGNLSAKSSTPTQPPAPRPPAPPSPHDPSRLRIEHGYAVVTALVLTTLMLTIGLAAFAFVDTEQKQSGRERERESRLNLTEGVLSSQIFLLSRNWPESALSAYPASCDQALHGPEMPEHRPAEVALLGGGLQAQPHVDRAGGRQPGRPGQVLLRLAADDRGEMGPERAARSPRRRDVGARRGAPRRPQAGGRRPRPGRKRVAAAARERGVRGRQGPRPATAEQGHRHRRRHRSLRQHRDPTAENPPSHKDNECEGFDPAGGRRGELGPRHARQLMSRRRSSRCARWPSRAAPTFPRLRDHP